MFLGLLEDKPVLFSSWSATRNWSRLGVDFSSLIRCNGVSRDFLGWEGRLSWQLELLDTLGLVKSNWGWLKLLDLLDIQVRNQVVSLWGHREQSSGRQGALAVSTGDLDIVGYRVARPRKMGVKFGGIQKGIRGNCEEYINDCTRCQGGVARGIEDKERRQLDGENMDWNWREIMGREGY